MRARGVILQLMIGGVLIAQVLKLGKGLLVKVLGSQCGGASTCQVPLHAVQALHDVGGDGMRQGSARGRR